MLVNYSRSAAAANGNQVETQHIVQLNLSLVAKHLRNLYQ